MSEPRRIERAPDGGFLLQLPPAERELLRTVRAELLVLLDEHADHDDLRRLFPPAHADDPEGEAEYRRLVGDELLDGRKQALATVEQTVDRDRLTIEEAEAWLTTLNDARLVLGTRLDVTEETNFRAVRPDDPRARQAAVYLYLSWLQEQLIEAMARG